MNNKKTLRTEAAHVAGTISSIFLNGLIAILPITLTIAIFRFSFKLIKSWVAPVSKIMPTFLIAIPHSEIILVILFIFLLGILLRLFVLRTAIFAFEALLFKIPLIRPIYSGVKQLVHAFNPQDTFSFKKVVLVEFPRKGLYSLGFVTSEASHHITPPDKSQNYFSVFVPTTPNPTTGFYIILPEEDIIVIDLNRQEAMALIISGGIIQPERFMQR
ncbi:MAG TPA: DUF502 domain-containing protein [Candidatus Babeliales bacterium]|nr:DUF502 domain-containing protein [Candidatus Babeliales bacterium]